MMKLTQEALITMGEDLLLKMPCKGIHEDPSLCIDAIHAALKVGSASEEQQKHAYNKFLQYRAEAYLFRSLLIAVQAMGMMPNFMSGIPGGNNSDLVN